MLEKLNNDGNRNTVYKEKAKRKRKNCISDLNLKVFSELDNHTDKGRQLQITDSVIFFKLANFGVFLRILSNESTKKNSSRGHTLE